MLAQRILKRIKAWTIEPLLWLGALIGYVVLVLAIKATSWFHDTFSNRK